MAVITLEDNVRIMTFRPPIDFDPLTASPAELERNGFPARPDDPRLLERFQRVFARLKGRFPMLSRLSGSSTTGRMVHGLAITGLAVSSRRRLDNRSPGCWARGWRRSLIRRRRPPNGTSAPTGSVSTVTAPATSAKPASNARCMEPAACGSQALPITGTNGFPALR